MGSIRPSLIACAVALALAGVAFFSGCFAVTDLDRFHGPNDAGVDDAGSDSSSRD